MRSLSLDCPISSNHLSRRGEPHPVLLRLVCPRYLYGRRLGHWKGCASRSVELHDVELMVIPPAHTFKANVAPTFDQLRSPAYVIDGQWTGQSKVTKARGKVLPEGSMFLDVPRASQAWTPAKVKDISEMGPMESRRVWKDVASGIRTGNFDQASAAKSKLENEQRQKRKDEQASGEPWALQLFTKIAQDQDCKFAFSLSMSLDLYAH